MQRKFGYVFILISCCTAFASAAIKDHCILATHQILNLQLDIKKIDENVVESILLKQQDAFSQQELSLIRNELVTLNDATTDVRKLESFITYIAYLPEIKRKQAVAEIQFFNNKQKFKYKYGIQFEKYYKKIILEQQNEYHRESKKLGHHISNSSKMNQAIHRKAVRHSRHYSLGHEKLIYGCHANTWNKQRINAGKLYKKFVLGIAIGSSLTGYTSQNFDKEKNLKWFGRIGYELSFSVLAGFLASKIMANPVSSIFLKGTQSYMMYRGLGLIDIGVYSKFFGVSKFEASIKLDNILKDKQVYKDVSSLIAYLEDQSFFTKFKENVYSLSHEYLAEFLVDAPVQERLKKINIDWTQVSEEDLKRDDVQSILMTAILLKTYHEDRGEFIQTGDAGVDRYAFHAIYNFAFVFRDIYISQYIYNVLCTGAMNPKRSLFKAISIYAISKTIFDQFYYYIRRRAINQ